MYFSFWYICIFKYLYFIRMNLSSSSDLPDVIINICAVQLWTIGKIELLAKTWVLQYLSDSSSLCGPSHLSDSSSLCGPSRLSDSSSLCGPSPHLTPNFSYNLRALADSGALFNLWDLQLSLLKWDLLFLSERLRSVLNFLSNHFF